MGAPRRVGSHRNFKFEWQVVRSMYSGLENDIIQTPGRHFYGSPDVLLLDLLNRSRIIRGVAGHDDDICKVTMLRRSVQLNLAPENVTLKEHASQFG